MAIDLWSLYRQMLKSRLFEEAVGELWEKGLVSGEMHMSLGEEAIIAGVLDHVVEGDALALDHRGTAPMLMSGVDPVSLLRELMGCPDGLCGGMGGHMHLFSRQHLAASSGIVGASGPAAAGFGLAAQVLRPGNIAVGFFGEGAANQGMLLEAINLAAVWALPVIFVCKDNDWAITTSSHNTYRGSLVERARSFGLKAIEVDGSDVEAVWDAAGEAISEARNGNGAAFLHAHCVHLEGHFLGDPYYRIARQPVRELWRMSTPLIRSFLHTGGARLRDRIDAVRSVLITMRAALRDYSSREKGDPITRTRLKLQSDPERLRSTEEDIRREIREAVELAQALG